MIVFTGKEQTCDFQKGQIVLIDKPLEWTSFDVVNKIRYTIRHKFNLKKIKVGHAGTLDPLATGLLVICTGKYTKQIESLQAQEKEYVTTLKLGATTPSFDKETEEDTSHPTGHVTLENINEAIDQFIGEQEQVAPMFSAKRVNGKRAYQAARKGETLELKSHNIVIHHIELMEFNLPYLKLRINCSKGTYIRSFARDFGEALKTGAYLNDLRRTKIGDFNVENALNISEFEKKVKNLQPISE